MAKTIIKGQKSFETWCKQNNREDLLAEWDTDKNALRTPDNTSYGSAIKIWWICSNGHSYQSPPNSRTNVGAGCPYCDGKKVLIGFNDLQTLKPKLSIEWDYERNSPLTPRDVTAWSGKKAWWNCSKGHEWESVISSRSNGNGCPYCAGKKVLIGFNDLATVRPELADEWNYMKNTELVPSDVTACSNRKVWWKCDHGHEWQAKISNRYNGRNCPICSASHSSLPEQGIAFYLDQCCEIEQRKIINGKEADIFLPKHKIAIEYDGIYYHKNRVVQDQKKNSVITAAGIRLIRVIESDINEVSNFNIYFKTDYVGPNYEWALKELLVLLSRITGISSFSAITVNIRADRLKIRERYSLIEKNNSLSIKFPEIAAEWNYNKNSPLKPDMFPANSNIKVWWKCIKGHEWESVIESRVRGNGCPYCSGRVAVSGQNDLATAFPDLIMEWNYEKNGSLLPENVKSNSHNIVWWKCSYGHEWQAAIYGRTAGNGCPYCSGRIPVLGQNDLMTVFPDLIMEWNFGRNIGIVPEQFTTSSGKKVWWKCLAGHEWQTSIINRTTHGSCCPICRRCRKIKNEETGEIFDSIKEASIKYSISISKISSCCRGNSKTAGGYHWKYMS